METENQIPTTQKPQANPNIIPAAIVIAGIVIAGAVYFSNNPSAPKTANTSSGGASQTENTEGTQPFAVSVDTNGWPVLGDSSAPITLVEYADFACPYCGQFAAETLPSIKKDYVETGKVKIIYKDFPVVGGDRAAEAAHCAEEQGKFWEYHDLLFSKQSSDRGTWNDAAIHRSYAQQLDLNADTLESCFNDRRYQTKVQESAVEAIQNGGQGTPFFLVNGTPIHAAQPYNVFQSAFEAELAK